MTDDVRKTASFDALVTDPAKALTMSGFKSMLAATLLAAMGAPTALAQENGGFEVELTIDRTGPVDSRTGLVIITGTVTCSEPALLSIATLIVELVQPVGRKDSARGFAGFDVACDVTSTPFERTMFGSEGRFGPGTAFVSAFAIACDLDNEACDQHEVITPVRLRPERLDLGS